MYLCGKHEYRRGREIRGTNGIQGFSQKLSAYIIQQLRFNIVNTDLVYLTIIRFALQHAPKDNSAENA